MELDTKLGDFAETQIEVDNYRQKVKDKYQALHLPNVTKITEMIEKFIILLISNTLRRL